MEEKNTFHKQVKAIYRLMLGLFGIFGLMVATILYIMADPDLSFFRGSTADTTYVAVSEEDDFDKIENGIHVRTGLVDAEGLMTVVNNCTNCHSARLVIQNRMNKERWISTIRWMQETQNLWDLGKNEDIIVDYLVTNYPPKKKGRREVLTDVDWYVLEE
ncbi:monoheme cytochrome C [Lentiprolixibacter aurantiacus]|uniref:Monoheme cytochrome C n=1 Tax=Lentiprolixibacter aurantiacus TaxID=2993939 RepID=A0AAE3MN86_9FLAO|nr:monoheme cytochrome C [Lentiprolixibacter aurantiacus]MCX2720323.1 monoheme cytochrome C [Lentiprolixibacter aurantiacus]